MSLTGLPSQTIKIFSYSDIDLVLNSTIKGIVSDYKRVDIEGGTISTFTGKKVLVNSVEDINLEKVIGIGINQYSISEIKECKTNTSSEKKSELERYFLDIKGKQEALKKAEEAAKAAEEESKATATTEKKEEPVKEKTVKEKK